MPSYHVSFRSRVDNAVNRATHEAFGIQQCGLWPLELLASHMKLSGVYPEDIIDDSRPLIIPECEAHGYEPGRRVELMRTKGDETIPWKVRVSTFPYLKIKKVPSD